MRCFGGHGLPKAPQQPGRSEEILVKAAAEIPLETVRAAITERPEGLKVCVGAEGGHFE